MTKHLSPINCCIEELISKIKKQWGHKHLYNDYQVLVDTLDTNRNLSKGEVYSLDRLVVLLLDETKHYFRVYAKWATRCLECASKLVAFLPPDYEDKEKRLKMLAEMFVQFVTDPNLSNSVHRDYYKEFIDNLADVNVELLCEMASNCFRTTSSGRRPWGIKDEIAFHNAMKEGYNLAVKYLSITSDFSHFPDWFSILNPCRTDSLIEEVSRWIDCNEDVQNLRWEHYSYEDVVACLEDTLDKQLSLSWKWLDGDAEGFVKFWGAERIEELLELVEDDVFFDVLSKLYLLKNNQDVLKVLEFYAEDDESQIKSYALKMLLDYH